MYFEVLFWNVRWISYSSWNKIRSTSYRSNRNAFVLRHRVLDHFDWTDWSKEMLVCNYLHLTNILLTDWSFVQRRPTDCGASLCVIKKPR